MVISCTTTRPAIHTYLSVRITFKLTYVFFPPGKFMNVRSYILRYPQIMTKRQEGEQKFTKILTHRWM